MLTLALVVAMSATPEVNKVDRTISVNGDAEVKVAPDTVQLTMSVVAIDKNLAKAKQLNDDRLKKLMAALTKIVDAKNVQSDQISISQRRESSSYTRDTPDAYEVRRSTVVTLKDVKRFEELLTAALDTGANDVDGINFQTSELRKHRDTARAMAMKACKEKATALAAEAGMKIGKPRAITEGSGGWGYWSPYSGRGGGFAQNAMQNIGSASEPSEGGFAPGMISVHASISVTYDLE